MDTKIRVRAVEALNQDVHTFLLQPDPDNYSKLSLSMLAVQQSYYRNFGRALHCLEEREKDFFQRREASTIIEDDDDIY